MSITPDRILLITALLAAFASLFFHQLNMRQSADWNAFTHCRLMDLERGDAAHVCKLGEE